MVSTSNDSLHEQMHRLHRRLITKIASDLDSESGEGQNFLFHIKEILGAGIYSSHKSVADKIKALETKIVFGLENYEGLKNICKDSGNLNLIEIIETCEDNMKGIRSKYQQNESSESSKEEHMGIKWKPSDIESAQKEEIKRRRVEDSDEQKHLAYEKVKSESSESSKEVGMGIKRKRSDIESEPKEEIKRLGVEDSDEQKQKAYEKAKSEIVYVSFMLAVYLVPARLCKPVFKDREIQIIKEQNPCHTEVSESPGRAGRENITDLHQLAVRIEGLQIVIEEAKDKITKGGEIVKACALVKFSNQAVNFSCTNIVANDEKEMADCLASSYQTINRFSMSVKEAKEEGESNGMLDKVMDLLEEVDRYTDQTLCAILKDLKSLGYNILFHKIPQRKNISIYNEFVEESKTKQFDSCFRVQTKLNRIQVFHVVYQLLDTYTDALQVMKKAFTETALPSTTTSTTPTTKFDIDQIIIG